jgi:hypothetical protein
MNEEEINTWEQKKRFHAMVRDIAKQVPWAGEMLDEEDWKRLVLAGAGGQKVVPNPFGHGFVVMNNLRVRNALKMDLSEIIEQLFAFGAEKGVKWTNEEEKDLAKVA